MNYFLNELARYFIKRKESKGKHLFVFPNRRSALFFRKYYALNASKPGWIPVTKTINDFMTEAARISGADPIELSFHTYNVFRQVSGSQESFDEFYPWGEMMITDFNDIDNYLINASDLFRNVADLKKLEEGFDYLSPEQKELIRRFWSFFGNGSLSEHQEQFLKMWDLLNPVYEKLRTILYEKRIGYEGLIYRHVAEEKSDVLEWTQTYDKVAFVGFNALNNCEKKVFKILMDAGRAEFYWDYDKRYLLNEVEEAGRFIRENLKNFPAEEGFDPGFNNLSKEKKVKIHNIPSDILQCKMLGEELKTNNRRAFHETAVVLGNEQLMSGVLTSLPEEITDLNISMGYPLTQTLVFSFTDSLLQLHQNQRSTSSEGRYYYRHVLMILTHQYIQSLEGEFVNRLINKIRKGNMIYIPADFFNGNDLLSIIFTQVGSASGMNQYLRNLLKILLVRIRGAGEKEMALEREYIFHILTRVNKLDSLSSGLGPEFELISYIRLLRKMFRVQRIPFSGEPLMGLQVMGILESRLLDFSNVHILSLNDGVMPERFPNFSYIPANLRLAFGLPTREDKDAIYAYYFFRLIQRAQKITLYFNGKSDGLRQGEPSRYIHQLRYLYPFEIEEKTTGFKVEGNKPVSISISKDEQIMEELKKFTSEGESYLSPSTLGTYLDCSLRFYFSYIAGIKEEDEVTEEIDAAGFGNIYHKVMEYLYENLKGKMVTPSDLKQRFREVDPLLNRVFREEFLNIRDQSKSVSPEGKNLIPFEVMRKFVHQTLLKDHDFAPFRYIDSERKVKLEYLVLKDGTQIRIGGKIDRLDERDGEIHIIDYKTGKNDLKIDSLELLFDRDSWKTKKYKALFQILIYSWIYSQTEQGSKVKPAVYLTPQLFGKVFTIYPSLGKVGEEIDFNRIEDDFVERLTDMITGIFNPEIPFNQTQDVERCSYCPYRGICHRKAGNTFQD